MSLFVSELLSLLRASWTWCSCSSGASNTNLCCSGGWREPQRMGSCWTPPSYPASLPGPQGCFPIRTLLQLIQICGSIITPRKLALAPFCCPPDTSYPLPVFLPWTAIYEARDPRVQMFQSLAMRNISKYGLYIPWRMKPELPLCRSHIPGEIPHSWQKKIFSSTVKHLLQGGTFLVLFFF